LWRAREENRLDGNLAIIIKNEMKRKEETKEENERTHCKGGRGEENYGSCVVF
jgi:hypothetical protein